MCGRLRIPCRVIAMAKNQKGKSKLQVMPANSKSKNGLWSTKLYSIFLSFADNEVKRNGVGKKMKSCAIVLVFLSFIFQQIRRISGGNGEPFGEKGQKNYENEEEGKIIPHR